MFFLLALFAAVSLFSADPSDKVSEADSESNINKLSEAFGHLIGKNIENIGVHFDIAHLIKGLEDAASGKDSPMSEAECVEAIAHAQEIAFLEQAKENLSLAEIFLKKNASEEGVISLEEGKLQYKIEKEGEGATVEAHYSPLIRYTGRYLDGSTFGASKEEELICLDETIAGFAKGLIGMQEGEKRTLYIHPELGYGTNGYLPPNSLLTFEVEIVKADAPNFEESVSISPQSSSDIALPHLESEIVR